MKSFAVIVVALLAGCVIGNRAVPVWSETMLWGKTLDIVGAQHHLGFIAVFANQPERTVYARQRPGAAQTLLGPIFIGTWRIEDGWLIVADDNGRVQAELFLQEARSGYFNARHRDGTMTRVTYLRPAKRPNKSPEPTSCAVTPAACAAVAPAQAVAHL